MASRMLTASVNSRSVILIGRTGSGKSSLGNSLVGTKDFPVGRGANSCTSTCDCKIATVDGKELKVVDTPGAMDTADSKKGIEELIKAVKFSPQGFHAFLLVLSLAERFTNEQALAVEQLVKLFGNGVLKYVIIVFTNGDRYDNDRNTLLRDLQSAPPALKELVQQCEERVAIVDNKDASQLKQQIPLLTQLVEDLFNENGNMYTNTIFELVQELEEEKWKNAEMEKALEDRENNQQAAGAVAVREDLEERRQMFDTMMTQCMIMRMMQQHEDSRSEIRDVERKLFEFKLRAADSKNEMDVRMERLRQEKISLEKRMEIQENRTCTIQ